MRVGLNTCTHCPYRYRHFPLQRDRPIGGIHPTPVIEPQSPWPTALARIYLRLPPIAQPETDVSATRINPPRIPHELKRCSLSKVEMAVRISPSLGQCETARNIPPIVRLIQLNYKPPPSSVRLFYAVSCNPFLATPSHCLWLDWASRVYAVV